ncbi:Hsp70 family protein [Sphaerisporangium sp. NPDC005289]|uniref:Hsp70 family protein n=1 Tax=Sphaerisporangium sp. NPDC005289 TaxID=3155247 RepID=UPI0033B7AAA0
MICSNVDRTPAEDDQPGVDVVVLQGERHRADDAALREAIDARNELDSIAYHVEQRLSELGDAVPVHEKARAEQLIADARQAVKEEAPVDRLRDLAGELQQVFHALGAGAQPRRPGQPSAGGPDEDVIDAEFTSSE